MLLVATFLYWYFRNYKTKVILAFALGFCWSSWYASFTLSWVLSSNNEDRSMLISGYVASLPAKHVNQTNFMFAIPSNVLIRLTWLDPVPAIKVGDKWQLLVKLKRIHGVQNPGGFDVEAWALQKGLRARGSVIVNKQNHFISHDYHRYPVDQFRQSLRERIQVILPHTSTAHWLMALIVGERNDIPQADWEVLRSTGTNHLMAIAGLHIGIIAWFVYVGVNWLWRRSSRLLLWVPAQQASTSIALIVAIIYSAIAGFSLPTQRASFMLIIFSGLLLMKRQTNAWYVWALALWFVLLLNPLVTLTESFWLSFGTIALIIYGMSGRLAPQGWWWKWGRVQWVIAVGLIPLSLMFFQECSLTSFIANSIAIPWLGFLILPLCFLSSIVVFVSPGLAKLLLLIAGKSLSGLWFVLSWFAKLHFSVWIHAVPHTWILVLSIIGILFLLLPRGMPGRWLGIVWLLPLLCYQPSKPKLGEAWVTLLDVGQGLSVVVQTSSHLLVYDAGMKFADSIDMGESVVLPFLRTLAVTKIDMLVVSHGDNDHIGGVAALLHALPIAEIKTSVPEKFVFPVTSYCMAGQQWEWDGIRFSFVHPQKEDIGLGNDSSCVLRIEQANYAALLTGDIEKLAERNLLQRNPAQLAASILVAPHHGSKTSGMREFIEAVHPQYVLYAVGYKNRYHFPHPSVVETYQQMNVQQLNSVNDGAIEAKLGKSAFIISRYRITQKRYWFNA